MKINCPKTEAISKIIEYFNRPIKKLNVFEFGRLRSLEENFKIGDGWSTYQLATNPNVSCIVSMDIDENTIQHCKNIIPEEYQYKIIYIKNYNEIPDMIFDFLYIDGPDSPEINFGCLKTLESN